jgi:hypothetical protein
MIHKNYRWDDKKSITSTVNNKTVHCRGDIT